jgi:hypothetical protein
MWYLLDRLGRPSLAQFLWRELAARQDEAARLLAGPVDPDARRRLLDVLATAEACCQVLRRTLPEPGRSVLKADLRRLRRATARLERMDPESRDDADRLQALVQRQASWLETWHAHAAPSDEALRATLARTYRQARRAVGRKPGGGRARRRLGRLVRLEELLAGTGGPTPDGWSHAAGERRALYEALQESRQLRRLADGMKSESRKDTRRMRRLIRRRQRELAICIAPLRRLALAETPAAYAAGLPWQVFRGLIDREAPGQDG